LASQCWDKGYGESWKRRYAIREDNKWKKNYAAFDGQSRETSPTPQPRRIAEPAPQQRSSNERTRIAITKEVKVWKYQGIDLGTFDDRSGERWRFVNDGISIARAALKNGVELDVEYVIEKQGNYTNKVVVDARRAGESAPSE
jgi:hypothetical protein